jgi:hypothetical protein
MQPNDHHRVLDAITTATREHTGEEVLVTAYIVIAAFADDTGGGSLYTETMDDQRCHESLGLLAFGLAHENHRAVTGDDD